MPTQCNPWLRKHLRNSTANYHQPPTEGRTFENMTKDSITEFFLYKKTRICAWAAGYISSDEIFNFSNNKNSRPSNFLFQIARGSGKSAHHSKDFFKTDYFKASRRKNSEQAWFIGQSRRNKEIFEFNREMLRGLSMWDPQGRPAMWLRVVGPGLAHR
jgi:hypothetical protein